MRGMRLIVYLLCILMSSAVFGGEIISARLSTSVCGQGGQPGEKIDSSVEEDFASCFKGVRWKALEASEDAGVFGAPIRFIVSTKKEHYVWVMNNRYGIFSVYRARKGKNGVFRGSEKDVEAAIDVYLPALYEKLQNAGINILSEKQLREIHRMPKMERRKFWRNYRPFKKPEVPS